MRAAVFTRYGPPEVIQIKDVAKPVPKNNEVLVRVRATTISSGWISNCIVDQQTC